MHLTVVWDTLETDDLVDLDEAATYAKYWITFLVFSVLPAPDSPLRKNLIRSLLPLFP